jgi:hypothetical protein
MNTDPEPPKSEMLGLPAETDDESEVDQVETPFTLPAMRMDILANIQPGITLPPAEPPPGN